MVATKCTQFAIRVFEFEKSITHRYFNDTYCGKCVRVRVRVALFAGSTAHLSGRGVGKSAVAADKNDGITGLCVCVVLRMCEAGVCEVGNAVR